MEEKDIKQAGMSESGWKFYAPTILTRQMILRQETLEDLTVYGPLTIAPNILIEDIEQKISQLTVFGPLDYPEYMEEVVRPRINKVVGPIRSYVCDVSDVVIIGRLILDESYLSGLGDGTKLAVLGSLRVPEELPNELIKQKIAQLFVSNGIFCREENETVLSSLLSTPRKMIVTPKGYSLIEKPVLIDRTMLESLPTKKLYCTGRVQIDPKVDARSLDKNLESIIVTDFIFCPVELLEVLYKKCKWHETRVVDYAGELWTIDDIRELPIFGLQALEGRATLIVFGELTIAAAIDPQLLSEKLYKVHNMGAIICTADQKPVLKSLLGFHSGEIYEYSEMDEENL
jgi:hypothetical protein